MKVRYLKVSDFSASEVSESEVSESSEVSEKDRLPRAGVRTPASESLFHSTTA